MGAEPTTATEAMLYFSDPEVAQPTIVALRWPNGITCPECGRANPRYTAARRIWECRTAHARKQFSAKRGTIFEDSPIGLDKWFTVIWMIANRDKWVSSHEIHRQIGITQKSAWFMVNRIQRAMETGSFINPTDDTAADRTFIEAVTRKTLKTRRSKSVPDAGGSGAPIVTDEADKPDDLSGQGM